MLPSRRRSGSWGGGPRTPPPASNSQAATPRHERSRSTTTLPSQQQQQRGDMTTEQTVLAQPEKEEDAPASPSTRVQLLHRQVAAAKQTETKMLEALLRQTKELEQAKIALEEARLELATLRQGAPNNANAGPAWSVMDLMFGGVDEEINGLRARLRAAALAEERSRTAADDLAAALSAVTMEAKQVKAWLADAQADLERASAEAGRLEALARATEAELWSATEQLDAVTSEWKEAADAWRAREKALLARARAAEGHAEGARQENTELVELRRAVDDENGGLRRALERAVEEANAANESLEFATGENSKLRDAVAEKEDALESLRRENEALKASEAAARGRAKDLDDQLAAATKKAAAAGGNQDLPLEKWRSAAFLDSGGVIATGRKDRMFASISNIAELRSAAAAAAMDDYDYEFDHYDGGRQYGGLEHAMKHKRRRSVLRKFGDFFRRRSFHKSEFVPVTHPR